MRVCCFVICYFGKLPNYMNYVLKTCAANPDYNWLLFTDDDTKYDYPPNFHVELMNFESFVDSIQKKFQFKLCVSSPHKLCDFKPAYGYLFEDFLVEYPFWGHCDLDQFFGNLKSYIPLEKLEKYDKVFNLGHMTIYRNCKQMNELFKITYKNTVKYNSYIQIFQDPTVLAFDEWGDNQVNINVLAEQEGVRICGETPMLDILGNRSYFISSVYDCTKHEWGVQFDRHFLICFDGNELYFVNREGGHLNKQRVAYAHLQKRHFKIHNGDSELFIIVPNCIFSQNSFQINNAKHLNAIITIKKIRAFLRVDECRRLISRCVGFAKYQLNKAVNKERCS